MKEVDPVSGFLGDGVIDMVFDGNSTHGNGGICEGFCHGEDVGSDVEGLGSEGLPCASESCDDFIEDEEYAVMVTDLA